MAKFAPVEILVGACRITLHNSVPDAPDWKIQVVALVEVVEREKAKTFNLLVPAETRVLFPLDDALPPVETTVFAVFPANEVICAPLASTIATVKASIEPTSKPLTGFANPATVSFAKIAGILEPSRGLLILAIIINPYINRCCHSSGCNNINTTNHFHRCLKINDSWSSC